MAGNASIYIADPSLIGAKLLMTFSEIKDYEGLQDDNRATGLRIDLGVSQIRMNYMPPERIAEHLNGFNGYVRSAGCADEDKLVYTLSRIHSVRFVIGCGIEPGFDSADKTVQFLMDFTARLNGLLFIHDSVIDYDGEILAGPLR